MKERTTSQVAGAALLGGMVGAGLALLLAPRSGKDTRDHIHQRFDDMKHTAGDKLEHVKSRLHRGAEEAEDMKDEAVNAARSTGRKAKAEMEELRSPSKRRGRKQSPVLSAWEEEV